MSENNPVPPEVTEEVSVARPPLFGRHDEIEAIQARLKRLSEGEGGTAGIRADSGLGKTQLVEEAAARAGALKIKTILIPCRGTLQRAFHPLAALVRALLDVDAGARSRDQFARLETALGELDVKDASQTLPRLLNLHILRPTGPLGESPTDSEDHFDDAPIGPSALEALPESLAELAGAVTRRDGPLLAVFDDLDEAHAQTISLFLKVVEVCAKLPVLFIATIAPNPPDELRTLFREDMMTLANLGEEPTLALAASLGGVKRLSAKAGEMVWKITGGDPLFLNLLMRDLGGAAQPRTSKGDSSLTSENLPSTLIQLIAERAASLEETQRATLECAAVLSDGFRMGALSSLRGRVPVAELESDLNTLIERGWLARQGKGQHVYFVFSHRIKRNVIYKNIPDERRAAMHKHAGDYYAVVSAGNRIRIENAIYHYLRSGDPKRALPVVEIAINKARATGERDQLASLYRLGLEVAATDSSLSSKQIELAERLGDLYAGAGDFATAVETYTKYSPPVTSAAILGKLGLSTLTVDPDRAANILSRSLSAVSSGKEEDTRWAFEASLCWALSISGNNYEAIRRCRDSLGKLGDTVGFGEARTMMRAILGMILFYEGDIHEANPHLESARAGWGARGKQDGIMLINQVLISMPKQDITRGLVKMLITPLLKE